MNQKRTSMFETLGAIVGLVVLVPVLIAGVEWIKLTIQSGIEQSDREIAEQEQAKRTIEAAQSRGLEACKRELTNAVAPAQVLDYYVPGRAYPPGMSPEPNFITTATGYSFTYGVDTGSQRLGAQCFINNSGVLLRAVRTNQD